ncbi:ATP-binding protein [Streptomyces sp. NPDC059853]|uniref:ATP-binding protein n=1 Tax=Streptomyces sp. NPDC059853 TaxID=3346973 RepID=UPI0036561D54
MFTSAAPVQNYCLTAPNLATTPRLARRHVAYLLEHTGHRELVDTAQLLVSEAVTNVFQHTRVPRLAVRTTVRVDRVLIRVQDSSPRPFPAPRAVGTEDERGRGLALLEMLAAAWGVTWHGVPKPEGKSVWFELRMGEE